MRNVVLALLLANLGLFAWSQWLAPSSPPAVDAAPASTIASSAAPGRAPAKILLASERPPAAGVATAAPAPSTVAARDAAASGSPDAASALPVANGSAVTGPGGTTTAADSATVAGTPPVAMAVAATAAQRGAPASAATAPRCVSMGPFSEPDVAAQAIAMLQKDGYAPRQRSAKGPVPDDYLVVVGRLRTTADQARVVRRLNRGGLDDAFPLPRLDDGYAVSVGVFSQAQRAERRRLAVGRMGVDAKVVERTRPGSVIWLDVDLKAPAPGAADPAEAWLKPAAPTEKLQVVACPQSRTVG